MQWVSILHLHSSSLSYSLPPTPYSLFLMAYIALYRKYRSQSFGELMGQEQVTVTLQNAIRTGRIAHACLFYGARGCGKTSTARLLARALNCIAQDGPTPEPCGVCKLCVSIRDGNCMDVIEMDAASETGIDDVREKIIESVQYAPGEARYKVYIIDEVHDLSAKAFDALLKTLEEPPPHVVFILATTEQHKVPITIRSRCMPYHFKRGTLQDLGASIERVVLAEGFTAEPEAIQAIARSAEGSWRDALSLLEQALAYSDGVMTAETVHRALGTVGSEALARVTDTLAKNDWNETLTIAAELIDSGKDVRQLLTALSGHLRDLMLICAGAKTAALQELGQERLSLLTPQAALFDTRMLLRMMETLSAAEREIRFTNQHRWLLERTLLNLMPSSHRQSQQSIETRASEPTKQSASRPPLSADPVQIPRPEINPSHAVQTKAADEKGQGGYAPPPPKKPAYITSLPEKPLETSIEPVNQMEEIVTTPASDKFAEAVSSEVVKTSWPRILRAIEKTSKFGASYLVRTEVTGLEGKTVLLTFKDAILMDRIHNKGRELVEKKINEVLNTTGYKIRCLMEDASAGITMASKPTMPVSPEPPRSLLDISVENAEAQIAESSGDGTHVEQNISPSAASQNHIVADSTGSYETSGFNGSEAEKSAKTYVAEAIELFGGSVIRTEPLS